MGKTYIVFEYLNMHRPEPEQIINTHICTEDEAWGWIDKAYEGLLHDDRIYIAIHELGLCVLDWS